MITSSALVALALVGSLPASAGASPADRAIAAAAARVQRSPDDAAAYVELAEAFLRKPRETAESSFYRRAAAALDRALAIDPTSYAALRTRAAIQLGEHDFRGARATAVRARRREPRDWWNYAVLADAAVELGDYPLAERAVGRLMALRPGLAAYSRAGHLRALWGDHAGALALLELAAATASPADPEAVAWSFVHLGHEHFAAGDLAPAAAAYDRALHAFPDHPQALAALARVRAVTGRLGEAAALYERAVARVPAPDVVAALGDVYAAAGDQARAEEQYAFVEYAARLAEATGTTYGRELALFYADHDRRITDAVRLAWGEAARRADVYTDDVLAWALYKAGRPRAAARAARRALRLGTRDARLHYHAGMIAAVLGRSGPAARHLRHALAINPVFDLRGAVSARRMLASLAPASQLARRSGEVAR